MSDEAPEPPRRRSPNISGYKTILVRFKGRSVDRDSPEFQEHLRKGRPANAPPIPDYLRNPTTPEADVPPAGPTTPTP